MNRRNFFSTLIKGVGVFSILPPAEMYSRIWKASSKIDTRFNVTLPFWSETHCIQRTMSESYLAWLEKHKPEMFLVDFNPIQYRHNPNLDAVFNA